MNFSLSWPFSKRKTSAIPVPESAEELLGTSPIGHAPCSSGVSTESEPYIPIPLDSIRQGWLSSCLSELWNAQATVPGGTTEDEIHDYIEKLRNIYILDDHTFVRPDSGTLVGIILTLYHGDDETHISSNDPRSGFVGCLQSIAQRVLADIYTDDFNANFCLYNCILQLIDIATLENSRIALVYAEHDRKAQEARDSYSKATEASKKAGQQYNAAKEQSDVALKEASGLKSELITILAIFASIILMFSSGLTIMGHAMGSLKDVLVYKVLVVVLICIFGLINGLLLLLYASAKIGDKSILVSCPYGSCSDKCSRTKKGKPCWAFNRFRRRMPYLFWLDVLIIVALMVTIVVWIAATGGFKIVGDNIQDTIAKITVAITAKE